MRMNRLSFVGISSVVVASMCGWACSSSSNGEASNASENDAGESTGSDAGNATNDAGPITKTGDAGTSTTDGGSVLAAPWGSIGASAYVACALGTGGIFCWSENYEDGGVGDPHLLDGTASVAHFVTTDGASEFLADGGSYDIADVCTVDTSGVLSCPFGAPDLSGVTVSKLTANLDGHQCAIDTSGIVKCWGDNSMGALGDGTANPNHKIVSVSLPKKAIDISAPEAGTCALLDGGEVYCWGQVAFVGNNAPSKLDLGGATAVALSSNVGSGGSMCAMLNDGSVKCFGNSFDTSRMNGAKSLSIDFFGVVCGVMSDASVKCLGASDPTLPEKIIDLSPGYETFVARGASGAVYRWSQGQSATKVTLP